MKRTAPPEPDALAQRFVECASELLPHDPLTTIGMTLPLLTPTLLFLFIVSTINAFQAFTQFNVLIANEGPNGSTNVLVFALWYWRIDGGGPHVRHKRKPQERSSFLFPQMMLPDDWPDAPSVLRFEGVDSCARVWLNGTELGVTSGSRLPTA